MKITLRIKPYIQPFERKLAMLEVSALAGAPPQAAARGSEVVEYTVDTSATAQQLAGRLAYWEAVSADREWTTVQSLAEATSGVVRNGIPLTDIRRQLPFSDTPALPNRRCLRYGTHGIHEYRGKFFPQLVRALVNIAGVPNKGVVADPMCGSGTTIVEAVFAGHLGLGADINPLSVRMARTKSALLKQDPEAIAHAYERIRRTLLEDNHPTGDLRHFESLPEADRKYLVKWFSDQVLRDLDRIVTAIRKERNLVLRSFLLLSLSNIIRGVSWQKLDDLRVRRDFRPDEEIDPIKDFLEEIGRSVRWVLALRLQMGEPAPGRFAISEQSATEIASVWKRYLGSVDSVITSPPYATALPYLDTDRLSLSYLQLLSRPMHRRREELMIGNREVTEAARRSQWEHYLARKRELPSSVANLIDRVFKLNAEGNVGFRRRNLPALLARYFFDMRTVLVGCKALLKPGRYAYVVVGNNSTTAGDEHVPIQTADLLKDLASAAGFKAQADVPMEMLVSRDIFKKNAMASETILCLRA